MKLDRLSLRSIHGQLTLLAWTFAGAVALSVLTLCLRDVFFERYVREKYLPLDESLEQVAKDLAAGRMTASQFKDQVERTIDKNPKMPPNKVLEQQVVPIYGAWITDPDLDPNGHLARSLLSSNGDFIIDRLRRTLVAGNPAQRSRALAFLVLIHEPEQRPVARDLCRYALERARRRHEPDLVRRASEALEQLQ